MQPYDLILGIVFFVVFMAVIVIHELKKDRSQDEAMKECDDMAVQGARVASEMYKRKYGRPSTELETAFPELKEPKEKREGSS